MDRTQELCELFAGIDARVTAIHDRQDDQSDMMKEIVKSHTSMLAQITALISQNNEVCDAKIAEVRNGLVALDRRVSAVENVTSTKIENIKKMVSFCVQLVWIILAAWILFKLNLSAP